MVYLIINTEKNLSKKNVSLIKIAHKFSKFQFERKLQINYKIMQNFKL